ncbi:MAG: Spy/CpxP family protein refolding chaperone [Bryobacterales bacterium]|nr:Spy/CpxP family protein refolding chaperone [Bryobacterales bacterium]
MRFQWFKLAAIPALAAGMAFAQTSPAPVNPEAGMGRGHFAHKRGFRGGRMAQYLGLTDAQKQQMRSIMQEAAQSAKPLRAQLRQDRQQIHEAVKANDIGRIQTLSTTEGQVFGQLAAIRSTAFAKVYNTVLTPEQRVKADQLPMGMRQMRPNRQHRGVPSPPNS